MARPRTFDERTVVEAAREQFRSTGYSGTSLDDLVKATGLGKASIYNAFGDKHALYVRAFENYCSEWVEKFRVELDGPDEAAAVRLRGVVEHMAQPTASPPMSCFLSKATAEMGTLDPEVAAIALQSFQKMEDALTHCVSAAQGAGDVPASRDPRSTARHILVALRGIEALAAAGVDHSVLADAAHSVMETFTVAS